MFGSTERRALRRAQEIISTFVSINDTIPVRMVHTLFTVALNEGLSLVDYMRLAGAPQSTMSRHLLDLGPVNRDRRPGYGLIQIKTDPNDRRRNVYTLSPAGWALITKIITFFAR